MTDPIHGISKKNANGHRSFIPSNEIGRVFSKNCFQWLSEAVVKEFHPSIWAAVLESSFHDLPRTDTITKLRDLQVGGYLFRDLDSSLSKTVFLNHIQTTFRHLDPSRPKLITGIVNHRFENEKRAIFADVP